MSTTPSAASPSAAVGAGSGPLARHRAAMAMASSIGPAPNCSHSSPSVTDLASASAASAGSSGSRTPARARAACQASVRARPATWTVGDPPASPIEASGRQRATPIEPISRTLRHIAGTVSPSGTCTATAIDRLAPMKRRSAPVRWAKRSGRSVTTTTWRGSSSSSAMSAAACPSAAAAVVTTARPPGPCGSQAAQSQRRRRRRRSASRQSAGPSHAASWTTIARSTPPAPGPVTASADPSDSSNGTGASVKRAASETTAPTSPVSGPSLADPSTTTSQPIVPVPSDTRRASACSARRAHRRASRHATVRTASTTVGVVATWCCQRAVRCTATAAAKRPAPGLGGRRLVDRRARRRREPRPTSRRRRRPPPRRAAGTWVIASARPRAPSRRRCNRRRRRRRGGAVAPIRRWSALRSPPAPSAGRTLGVRCRVRRQGSAGSVVSAAGPARRRRATRRRPARPAAGSCRGRSAARVRRRSAADRFPVDAGGHPSGQLHEPHAAGLVDVELAVVRFERRVGQGHVDARCPSDHVLTGGQARRPGPPTGRHRR